MTLQLRLTIGLPGSGKTECILGWVREDPANRCHVSRDDLRRLLFGHTRAHYAAGVDDEARARMEALVTAVQYTAIAHALAAGRSVGVDDTNLDPMHRAPLEALGVAAGADVAVIDLRDVPLEVCIRRDQERFMAGTGHMVGDDVLRWLHATYIAGGAR